MDKVDNMNVLIADQINQKGIEELEEVAEVIARTDITPEELVEDIKDFDAIVVRSRTKVTREVIEAAPSLKIIARAGVGVDNVDVEAATERGIMVVNAPESTSITVAEHTMGLVLSMSRKIAIADKSVKEGKWEKSRFMGMELNGKTLGIVGMGRIGSQVVIRAKAFGMDIMVYDPYITPDAAAELGVEVVGLETLLVNADVITIHVPLTPETKYLISKPQFEIMKENAIIVNCARGGIIKEDDLYDALSENVIGGAALDVFETEPPRESSLLKLDNVVLTPHIAASTSEAQRDAAIIVAKEIKKVFQGESPKNVINMPVMDPETFQLIKPFFGLAEKLGIDENSIRSELRRHRGQKESIRPTVVHVRRSAESKQTVAEEFLLRQALEHPDRFAVISVSLTPDLFQSGPNRNLAEVIWQSFADGETPRAEDLVQKLDEESVQLLSRLMLNEDQGSDMSQALDDCIRIILLAKLNEKYELHRMQADEMLRRGDSEYVQELMNAQRILTKISDLTKSQG